MEEGYDTQPDENGIKTVVEFGVDSEGRKIKTIKQVKVNTYTKKVNKRVVERQKRWVKFGKCANAEGLEIGISSRSDEVQCLLGDQQRILREREQERKDKQMVDALFQKLSADNALPIRAANASPSDAPAAWRPSWKKGGSGPPVAEAPVAPVPTPGKYVLPVRKSGAVGGEEETSTLRITNLSDEITEQELHALFRPFGGIQRVHLVKDKITLLSRGFAFLTFYNPSEAKNALEKLNGKGYEHLILNIEYSKAKPD